MNKLIISLLLLTSLRALECDQGSVPDPNNICINPKYIEGCFKYATQNKCQKCDYNYELEENGLCNLAQSPQPCCLDQKSTYCKQCNVGLASLNGQCKYAQILGCLQKNYLNKCVNCASDFNLINGKCSKGIKDCEEYGSEAQEICTKCRLGFSLVSNICLRNTILGCKNQQSEACSECFYPFKESEGHCEIENCKNYNDFGCEACECGFYITKERICMKVEEGCIRYQKGHCTDCYPPFKLKGISCSIEGCLETENGKCEKCEEPYILSEDKCVIENCLEWENNECIICEEGYNYQNGQCVKLGVMTMFNN